MLTQKAESKTGEWNLFLNRTFNYPVDKVFEAWTDPAALRKWFCNHGEADFNVKEGGSFTTEVMCDTKGKCVLMGGYLEVVKNKKIVFSWQWQDEPLSLAGETIVTVEFIDLGDSTEIRLTQSGFANEDFRNSHIEGWNAALDRIENLNL